MKDSIQSDSGIRLFVWGVWAAMLFFALFTVYRYGRNIPVIEDWVLVPPLTGNENILEWLWKPNSEHRIPLPKLILLGLLKLTHGDFRSGMYFTVLMVGTVAALMISGIRGLRGGTSRLVDAFFPLALLHMGHWENFCWSFQLALSFGCVLVLLLMRTAVIRPYFNDPGSAILGGLALVCLPLSGAPGLLAVPFFGSWMTYCAIWNHLQARKGNALDWVGPYLISCIVATAALVSAYFPGLEPTGYPESPSLAFTLSIFSKFLGMSMGLGPVLPYTFPLVALLIVTSVALAVSKIFLMEKEEKHRAIALALMLVTWTSVCFLTAVTRAGLIFTFPRVGPMSRYILLFCPIIILPYFIWEKYGSRRLRVVVQVILFLAMLILVPVNYHTGSQWGQWYLQTYEKVVADIRQGTSALEIARRHKDDLAHWYTPELLADHIKMLHDAKMTIFARLPDSSF